MIYVFTLARTRHLVGFNLSIVGVRDLSCQHQLLVR